MIQNEIKLGIFGFGVVGKEQEDIPPDQQYYRIFRL